MLIQNSSTKKSKAINTHHFMQKCKFYRFPLKTASNPLPNIAITRHVITKPILIIHKNWRVSFKLPTRAQTLYHTNTRPLSAPLYQRNVSHVARRNFENRRLSDAIYSSPRGSPYLLLLLSWSILYFIPQPHERRLVFLLNKNRLIAIQSFDTFVVIYIFSLSLLSNVIYNNYTPTFSSASVVDVIPIIPEKREICH